MSKGPYEKIVLVTKRTPLEELVLRFNTLAQARFYVKSLGQDFSLYDSEHRQYIEALRLLKAALPTGLRSQIIERNLVPTFQFGPQDLVVTLGPDGLVVNVAKYLKGQPLLGLNPDIERFDGMLLPVESRHAAPLLRAAEHAPLPTAAVTMAEVTLNDGQRLLAVNDFFIGNASHVSARYTLRYHGGQQQQSSSGVLVSTGAGSTGWFRSVVTGATLLSHQLLAGSGRTVPVPDLRFSPAARKLIWTVREPFPSRTTGASMLCGTITEGDEQNGALEIVSHMPQHGVIFSDGIESDFLSFGSGTVARIAVAPEVLNLVGASFRET